MSDIKFDIEVNGIEELNQAADNFQRLGKVSAQLASQYKPLGAQTVRLVREQKRLEGVHKALNKAIEKGTITSKDATTAMQEEIRASKERILTDKNLIAQAKKRAKAEQDARRETERLTKAYAPARVAADLYQKKIIEIEQAQKRNIITEKEARQSLALLTKEYYDFTQGAATGGNQFAKFNVETYKANQRLKRFTSTGLQQAGYQFGDFAVQVQSGTNVAVAFGQQMSQLLGIFGAGGALAGAGVAIGTAFIAPLLDAQREVQNLADDMQALFDKLEANKETAAGLIEGGFAGPLERARQTALDVLEVFNEIDRREAKQSFAAGVAGISDYLDKELQAATVLSRGGIAVGGKILAEGTTTRGRAGTPQERQEAEQLRAEIVAIQLSILELSRLSGDELAAGAVDLANQLSNSSNVSGDLLKKYKELLETSGLLAINNKRITAEQAKQTEQAANRTASEKEFVAEAIRVRDRAEKAQLDRRRNLFAQAEDALTDSYLDGVRTRLKGEASQRAASEKAQMARRRQIFGQAEDELSRAYIEGVSNRLIEQAARERAAYDGQIQINRKAFAELEADRVSAHNAGVKKRLQAEAKVIQQQAARDAQAKAALAVDQARERLSYAQLQYGKDSERARMYELALAEIQVREAEKLKGTSSDIVDELVAATRQHLENKFLLQDQVEEAKELEAKLRAARRAFETLDISQIPGEGAAAATQQQRIDELKKAWEDFKNKRDKGSAKTLTNIQDTIDALREQTDQERKLLGLTGERLKEEEIFYDLVQANKDADIKLSEEKLRAVAKEIAAQKQANEMYEKAIGFVDGMTDAFSDFIANGLDDFKSFVNSIKDMFVRLLADMAAQAAANRILIPIATGFMAGAGNAAAGTIAGAGAGGMAAGTIGATLATGASAFGAGFTTSLGFGTTTTGATAMALNPTLAAIGAAAPYILAAVAVIGLFTSKIKKLDEGVRVTVNGMDTLVESFETFQKSRLFGLLKSKPFTEYEEVDDSPLLEAVASMQESVLKAANSLGIGTEAFNDFSYQFQVSLQGLTEQEKIQKINEELAKMGDAFASLSGHFSNMNDLLAVAQQRYDLETRLLQLQGDATALLARQREREIAATHELNQALLVQIHAVEDANIAVDQAFAAVQRSIQARKDSITRSFNEIMETIQLRISEANETVGVSRSILSSLEGASGGSDMTREAGLAYLRELRGASRISDQKKLDKALKAISDPSEGLYKNFVDYQRDFSDQRNLIRELEDKAGVQLGIDEQTLIELQEQAEATRTRHEEQLAALDEQLQQAQNQINELRNIDTSVKSVTEAIGDLEEAIMAAMEAMQAASKLSSGGVAQDIKAASDAGAKVIGELGSAGVAIRKSDGAAFEKVIIRGSEQLQEVANSMGIATKGKTGAQIQQEISNVGNIGVNMDNATRAEQFALGGYFSGGLRMVGERGPELEMTGPSRIMSNSDTRKMLQNPDLVEAVKDMKQEISELRNEQRQLGINNNKYTKRTYDLYRQWDTEGLPAERT